MFLLRKLLTIRTTNKSSKKFNKNENNSSKSPKIFSDSEESTDQHVQDDIGLTGASECARLKTARHSVSAEVYGDWNKRRDFVAPVYPKTSEQEQRITELLKNSFIFQFLSKNDLNIVIAAFKEVSFKAGSTLIQQGDDGDCLYITDSADLEVFITDNGETKKVGSLGPGELVGELALLYNAPRAATVVCKTDSVLWQLNRETFNHIIKKSAIQKREQYDQFLKQVELFKDIRTSERHRLADVLRQKSYAPNQVIIKENDIDDHFYIIESGTAKALKGDKEVMRYKRGDYFGELALLRNQRRAATVMAIDNVSCLYLDRKSFEHLLGPIEDILRRNAKRYNQMKLSLSLGNDKLNSSL